MLCPQDSRLLPIIEKVRIHIIIRANHLHLFFCNACRSTERRIMG